MGSYCYCSRHVTLYWEGIPMRQRYGSLISKEDMAQKQNTTKFRILGLNPQIKLKEEMKQRKYIHIS